MKPAHKNWGVSPQETHLKFPCDKYQRNFSDIYFRGITILASPEIIFQWLCQMRVAPYSYDWIDNLGRKSPQRLLPGFDQLEIGQRIMTIFSLIDFKQHTHLTLRLNKQFPKFLGDTIITYKIFPKKKGSRLLIKILVNYPKGLPKGIFQHIFSIGDLIMMRRQLLNFKALSEQPRAKHDKG